MQLITNLNTKVYFLGKDFNFSPSGLEASWHIFKKKFCADNLFLLNQEHGKSIIEIKPNKIDNSTGLDISFLADGFYVKKKNFLSLDKNAFVGIRTADCLPIFLETKESVCLLHAGWKGLSLGILEECLELIKDQPVYTFLVGPSVSFQKYEVGLDVIESFKEPPVYTAILKNPASNQGGYLLDLKLTALKLFEEKCAKISSNCLVKIFSECTVMENNWHSYRRDKHNRGSNLMFCQLSF